MIKQTIKKYISILLRAYYKNKSVKTYNQIVRSHIQLLKKEGKFRAFPSNNIMPIIDNYGLRSKSFSEHFEFFYSVSGFTSPYVIPEPIYLIYIEPILNKTSYSTTISDKNFYDLFLKDIKTPKTLIRKINNQFYDFCYKHIQLNDNLIGIILNGTEKVILKPSIESGAGQNIELFEKRGDLFRTDNVVLNTAYLQKFGDFVLQDFIKQHEFFKQFNKDSNNTVRVLVYRSVKNDTIHILHRLLRIGKKGSYLDHDNQGGVTIGISDAWILNDAGRDYHGRAYETFNDIAFPKIGTVPFMNEIEEAARKISSVIHYARLLAIDFSINEDGEPVLIEINTRGNGIGQYQMNNGPVFGDLTKEILDYCLIQETHPSKPFRNQVLNNAE